jgi:hypothetical protein
MADCGAALLLPYRVSPVQVDPNAPITWDDDYKPILKEKYRRNPAYAHLLALTSGAGTGAAVSTSSPGAKRKHDGNNQLEEDAESFKRGVPSKRPRPSLMQALREQSSSSAVSSSPRSGRSGDKRAPTAQRGITVAGNAAADMWSAPLSAPAKSKAAAGKSKATGTLTDTKPKATGKTVLARAAAAARGFHGADPQSPVAVRRGRPPAPSPSPASVSSRPSTARSGAGSGGSDDGAEREEDMWADYSDSDADQAGGKASVGGKGSLAQVFTSGYFSRAPLERASIGSSSGSSRDTASNRGPHNQNSASTVERTAGNAASVMASGSGTAKNANQPAPPLTAAVASGQVTLQLDAHTVAQLQRALLHLNAPNGGAPGSAGTGAVGSTVNSAGHTSAGGGIAAAPAANSVNSSSAGSSSSRAAADNEALAAAKAELAKLREDLESQRRM